MLSRRTLLKGMAAGAALTGVGPLGRVAARASVPRKRPGSRPFPDLPVGTDTLPKISHIVVLMMENHSFDSHLGMLRRGDGIVIGADGRPTAACPGKDGKPVRAYHAPTLCQTGGGVSQSWNASHLSYNNAANDGFVRASSPQAMAYCTRADLPYYYALARQFPTAPSSTASTTSTSAGRTTSSTCRRWRCSPTS